MDINVLRSVVTVVSLLMFVALALWVWNPRRRSAMDEAARLPFNEEAPGGAAARANPNEGRRS